MVCPGDGLNQNEQENHTCARKIDLSKLYQIGKKYLLKEMFKNNYGK